jgi:hypothetical protein
MATTTTIATYAALSDFVYHRDPKDFGMNLRDILGVGTTGRAPAPERIDLLAPAIVTKLRDLGLTFTADGFIYGEASGFVATVVKVDEKYVIVFRGTDAATAGPWTIAKAIAGYGKDIDVNDMRDNKQMTLGTLAHGQSEQAIALTLAVKAAFVTATVEVTGQQ